MINLLPYETRKQYYSIFKKLESGQELSDCDVSMLFYWKTHANDNKFKFLNKYKFINKYSK